MCSSDNLSDYRSELLASENELKECFAAHTTHSLLTCKSSAVLLTSTFCALFQFIMVKIVVVFTNIRKLD